MSERFKYAKNGICRVENFAEHLAAGTFPRIELGQLCGMEWCSEIRIDGADNEIYPMIYCDNNDPMVEHCVQIYSKLVNHSEHNRNDFKKIEKEILKFDKASRGFDAPILEILDLKNRWLDDGTLSFEYGIQVEAVMENEIRTFNFNDKLFNAGAEMVQFDRIDDPNTVGPLYAHKLLLSFHSAILKRYFKLESTDESLRIIEWINLFQICHGVRLNFDKNFEDWIILISYIDWFVVHAVSCEPFDGDEDLFIFFAIKFYLRHFLAFILKSVTSLKEVVSKEDVEIMSSESMKMLIAKFLYEKF